MNPNDVFGQKALAVHYSYLVVHCRTEMGEREWVPVRVFESKANAGKWASDVHADAVASHVADAFSDAVDLWREDLVERGVPEEVASSLDAPEAKIRLELAEEARVGSWRVQQIRRGD